MSSVLYASQCSIRCVGQIGPQPSEHRNKATPSYPVAMGGCRLPVRDVELVQIVDAELVEAGRKAGEWLVCRAGCTQCCVGAFAIHALDAARLRHGLSQMEPVAAERIRTRAREYVARIAGSFPGNPKTGLLDEGADSEARFEDFANEEVCPALDPQTGLCELYEWRPMTCRVFGPPVRTEDGHLGVCELCFHGASDEQIAACEMKPDPDGIEDELLGELAASGERGSTIVAYALLQ